jgi:indole-3-glycerol phosphate synthase
MTILDEIFAHKKIEVATAQQAKPLAAVRAEAETVSASADFVAALTARRMNSASTLSNPLKRVLEVSQGIHPLAMRPPALIAEVKKASPSRGLLCPDFDPLRLARAYAENGASAISVLTDEKYFQGHLDYLRQIHIALSHIPLLRKDFILDPYQVYEARAAGASAVLLIAAYLEPHLMADLHALTLELGMAALVEVHDENELHTTLQLSNLQLLGVNNRNLHDFSIKLETCLNLRPLVPPEICFVAESAIHTRQDVVRLASAGVDAMLIGEALVVARDRVGKIRELMIG